MESAVAKTFDGIIIGAGVMGASCAMHLASAGLKNLLGDRKPWRGSYTPFSIVVCTLFTTEFPFEITFDKLEKPIMSNIVRRVKPFFNPIWHCRDILPG